MLANPIPLKIVPFTNPSGVVVHRVTGMWRGKRLRKNFAEAGAAQDFVNRHVVAVPGVAIPRPIITILADGQVREAEAAQQHLPPGTSLTQAVEFFAAHYRPLQVVTLAVAAERFEAWLLGERKNDPVTAGRLRSNVVQWATAVGMERTDEITPERARAWIYAAGCLPRTQRDRFDQLNGFCAWLAKKKHATRNVIADLDRPVVKVDAPGVCTFDEVWRLLHCALSDAEGPDMLPFFAICALSGVRPAEVPRLSAEAVDETGKPNPWADIYLEDEHRLIEVNKAKGGRSRRNVTIGDPLWRILTWCKAQGLAANFFSKRKFDRIRRRAGLFAKWEKDLLRHTYASHAYITAKDTKKLTADMGNSEHVLFQHYIRPVPLADGVKMAGLCLHYSAPREKSAMGTGPKVRGRGKKNYGG